MRCRVTRKQMIIAAVLGLFGLWLFAIWPFHNFSRLPCAAAPTTRVNQISQCVATVGRSLSSLKAFYCDEDGSCSADKDLPASGDGDTSLAADFEALQSTLRQSGALSNTTPLFDDPVQITIPAKNTSTLQWQKRADGQIRSGYVSVEAGDGVEMTLSIQGLALDPEFSCTALVRGETAWVSASGRRDTTLDLVCTSSQPCRVRLHPEPSDSLTGYRKCEGE